MSYIFVTGAPGSRWSSVVKNIYYSPDVDRSDSNTARQWNTSEVSHLGAYFDPGMESDIPADLTALSRQELQQRFDQPFGNTESGCRIIKSHVFALNIDYLQQLFPEVPWVLCYRSDADCMAWWCQAGAFDIVYPNYRPYYRDLETMAQKITEQNCAILRAWPRAQAVDNNQHLAQMLGLAPPPESYRQCYAESHVSVAVIPAR